MKCLAVALVAVIGCGGSSSKPSDPAAEVGIVVSASHLDIDEGDARTVEVSLDHAPTTDLSISLTSSSGVTASPAALVFTHASFDIPQVITVAAPTDQDTADSTAVVEFAGADHDASITVSIHDGDTQAIVATSPTVTVTEGQTGTFTVALAFAPTGETTIQAITLDAAVATVAPSTLTFTTANYSTPQTVTVTAPDDMDIVAGATKARLSTADVPVKDVTINVTDNDQQRIILNPTTITIPEGEQRTIHVSLAYDPITPATLNMTNNGSTSVGVQLAMVTFDHTTWSTGHDIVVGASLDRNAIAESGTITLSQPTTTVSADLTINVQEMLAREYYGWPDDFQAYVTFGEGPVVAYRITGVQAAALDYLGVHVSNFNNFWAMALYTDNAGAPGSLVPGTGTGPLAGSEFNNFAVINPVPLTAGTYWIALRIGGGMLVNTSDAGVTATVCRRTVEIPDITTPWPTTFGAATCQTEPAANVWIDTKL